MNDHESRAATDLALAEPVDLDLAAPTGAQTVRAPLRRLDGDLGALEDRFRAEYLAMDRRLMRRLLLAWAGCLAALLIYQWTLLASVPGFGVVRALNLTNLAWTLAAALLAGHVRAPRRLDLLGGAWYLGTALLVVIAQQYSGPRIAHGGAVLAIVSFTLLFPVPMLYRALPALLLAGASLSSGLAAVAEAPELRGPFLRNMVVLVLAFVVALAASMQVMRGRRERFVAEREKIRALEQEAELARLLPVCAYCRQVRRDDGFWETASSHLQRRGIVRGEARLCDTCVPPSSAVSPPGGSEPVASVPAPMRSGSPSGPETRAASDDATRAQDAFRLAHLEPDRKRLLYFLGAMAIFFAFATLRFVVSSGAVAWTEPVQWGRVATLILTLWAFFVAMGVREPRHHDRLAFGYLLSIAILASVVMLLTPSPNGIMPIVAVVMVHVLLRIPLWQRMIPTVLFSIVAAVAVVLNAEQTGYFSGYTLVALVFANLIGVWASQIQDEDRQARFDALLERERAVQRAEQLDLLMPMCGGCGKIRDDEGYWDDVFAYLARHSRYRASHGICPDCVRQQFPEMADEVLEATGAR
ncbi:MAG: hypothetical protein V2I63_09535 [Pseudomonadales bacterium]|jgi:hypothetical protein|nr:hypothetical protein [Pseudomonadales bacterium]